MLVPNIHVNDVLDLSFLSWILVIEKEVQTRRKIESLDQPFRRPHSDRYSVRLSGRHWVLEVSY
jgi:hypothetical protein